MFLKKYKCKNFISIILVFKLLIPTCFAINVKKQSTNTLAPTSFFEKIKKLKNFFPKGEISSTNFKLLLTTTLQNQNFDVDKKNEDKNTALYLAAYHGYFDSATLLLEQKADINAKTNGSTPLHTAAYHCRTDIVKLLLKEKAGINIQDEKMAGHLCMLQLKVIV